MKPQNPRLGALGEQFFSYVQLKNQTVVRSGDLLANLNITAKQEKELLSRLARSGYIVRLTKGAYLVPTKLPPGGKWMPNEYTIIYELMALWDTKYQICGPLAFQKFGFSEQIPNAISIYNTRKTGLVKIGSLRLQLIKVADSRLGATDTIKLKNNRTVFISNEARTIVDAIYDWSRFNMLPAALDWIQRKSTDINFIDDIIEITCQYSNTNTIRRIGYWLEQLNVDNKKTKELLNRLKPSQGWTPLIPTKPARGRTNKKWGIIDNAKGTEDTT